MAQTSIGVDVRQDINASRSEPLVPFRRGGAIGSFHHKLALQLIRIAFMDDAANGSRHQDVARDGQNVILLKGLSCARVSTSADMRIRKGLRYYLFSSCQVLADLMMVCM